MAVVKRSNTETGIHILAGERTLAQHRTACAPRTGLTIFPVSTVRRSVTKAQHQHESHLLSSNVWSSGQPVQTGRAPERHRLLRKRHTARSSTPESDLNTNHTISRSHSTFNSVVLTCERYLCRWGSGRSRTQRRSKAEKWSRSGRIRLYR